MAVFAGASLGTVNRWPFRTFLFWMPMLLACLVGSLFVGIFLASFGQSIAGEVGGWIAFLVGLLGAGSFLFPMMFERLEPDMDSNVVSSSRRFDRFCRLVWLLFRLGVVLLLFARWWILSGDQVRRFDGHERAVTSVAFSPDGRRILSGSPGLHGGQMILWDTETGQQLLRFEERDHDFSSVAFDPTGKLALSGSRRGVSTLRLWSLETGQELVRFDHVHSVFGVALSRDASGAGLLALAGGTLVGLWDAQDGRPRWTSKQLLVVNWAVDVVEAVAFSPDGGHISMGSRNERIYLVKASGKENRQFKEGHTAKVTSVAFSPDGRYIVSGSADRTVRLWDVENGTETLCFQGHTGVVTSVAFSPDGRRILSGSADRTVRLWAIMSGQELRCFKGHAHIVRSVAFSPDGRRALSGAEDGTVRLWKLPE
jgi:WD40 repeat protein